MVEIALNALDPLGNEVRPSIGARDVETPVAVLAPNDVALAVAIVEEAGLKDLLMQSCAIESARHRALDVAQQLLVDRSGVDSVGIEALVEDESLEYALAVEIKESVLDLNRAHTEICLDLVVADRDGHIVKSARADLPKVDLGELDGHGSHTVRNACLGAACAVSAKACLDRNILALTADRADCDGDGARVLQGNSYSPCEKLAE